MARDINDTSFNESYTGGTATFDRHHGGRLFHSRKEKRMKEIARKKVEEVKPDVVVLQAGGNDLQSLSRQGKPVLTPIHIAQEIIGTGTLCKIWCHCRNFSNFASGRVSSTCVGSKHFSSWFMCGE